MSRLKGQQSFLRTADEAKRLFRAVDDVQSVKIRTVDYKAKSGYKYYGVLFGHTLISDRLPKAEAEMVRDAIATAMQRVSATMAQRAIEIMQGRVLAICGEPEPVKAVAEVPEAISG